MVVVDVAVVGVDVVPELVGCAADDAVTEAAAVADSEVGTDAAAAGVADVSVAEPAAVVESVPDVSAAADAPDTSVAEPVAAAKPDPDVEDEAVVIFRRSMTMALPPVWAWVGTPLVGMLYSTSSCSFVEAKEDCTD